VCIYIYIYICVCVCVCVCVSLHTKIAAVACLVERQFLPAMENRVKFLILWHRILRLIFSINP